MRSAAGEVYIRCCAISNDVIPRVRLRYTETVSYYVFCHLKMTNQIFYHQLLYYVGMRVHTCIISYANKKNATFNTLCDYNILSWTFSQYFSVIIIIEDEKRLKEAPHLIPGCVW